METGLGIRCLRGRRAGLATGHVRLPTRLTIPNPADQEDVVRECAAVTPVCIH
jgi:hypothetical protein